MRAAVLLTLAGLAGAVPSAEAQQWSPGQQEVITQLKQCWDVWMDGVRSGSPEAWLRDCTEPGFTFWGPDGAPAGADVIRRNWKNIAAQDLGWLDVRPLGVRLIGDVALVQFYGYWSAATPSGPAATEWKRTEVFHKVNGKWLFVMGHSSPVADKDVAPYKN
jgi:ketosteroid isomerase-like protein